MRYHRLFALLLCAALAALCLCGCQSGLTAQQTQSLLDKLEEIDERLDAMESRLSQGEGGVAPQSPADPSSSSTTSQSHHPEEEHHTEEEHHSTSTAPQSPAAPTAAQADPAQLEQLTQQVEALEALAQAAKAEDGMDHYFDLRTESSRLDRELDLYEDALEADLRSGLLTREDYRTGENEVDRLEDRLDLAEDLLERTYGIIDD